MEETSGLENTLKQLDFQQYPLDRINDIMYHIITSSGLSFTDITNLARTNKNLRNLINNKIFWRNMFIDRFLIQKRNVTPKERTTFLEKTEPHEIEKWDMESNVLTNPFVHYITKAYMNTLDSNVTVKIFKGKEAVIIYKTKYDRVKNDMSVRGKAWKLEKSLKKDDVVYVIKPNPDAEDTMKKLLDNYDTYEMFYGDYVVLENNIIQVIYAILKNGFKSYSLPLELQTCISCQLEQATLKDQITGLKFCSQECFDEFGI